MKRPSKPPAAKRSKAKRAPSKPKQARRVKVAEAIVEGKSLAEIARDLEVSRSTAHRDATSPEVRQILSYLVSDKLVLLEFLLDNVLEVIWGGLQAEARTLTKEAVVITVGPDHYARLAAAKRFIELTTAGRPLPKPPEPRDDKRTLTLAEFQELVRQQQESTSGTSPN